MNIEKDLARNGIANPHKINIKDKLYVCRSISKLLSNKIEFLSNSSKEIMMRLYSSDIYYAEIDEKYKGVFYYYKTNTLYLDRNFIFKDGYDEIIINSNLIHEIIHILQNYSEIKNKNKQIGICRFDDLKIFMFALNEAFIEYYSLKCSGKRHKRIKSEEISIYGMEDNSYKYLTSLTNELIYLLGEEKIQNSLFNSNDIFENDFFNHFEDNGYYIVESFEYIFKNSNNLNLVLKRYIEVQKVIYQTYFEKNIRRLKTIEQVDDEVEKLEEFANILGITKYNIEENEFEIFKQEMEAKLLKRYAYISNKNSTNSLVLVNNNLFSKIKNRINMIRFRT